MINKKRLLDSFLELIQIESESGQESKLRKHLLKKLSALKIDTAIDKKGNLYGLLLGNPEKRSILLSAHLDTVVPGKNIKPIIKNNIIYSDGKTILGSDDKSGIAQIIECLTVLIENKLSHPNITVLFTVEEEIGLKGAKKSKLPKIDLGIVLDACGEIGTIYTKAPSQYTFSAQIKGKAAHAGIEPENGINAILVASKAISQCTLGRINNNNVANIGIIQGGNATNIVPAEVLIQGEARSFKEAELTKNIRNIKAIFQKECSIAKAQLNFQINEEYHTFSLKKNEPIIKLCKKAANLLNLPFKTAQTGGGSDANIFNTRGIKTIVMSTGMQKVHTTQEFIKISDLENVSSYLLEIIKLI